MKQMFFAFYSFLNEHKVMGLAIAFVMGAAATSLVQSLVNNIIMPILTPVTPGESWQTMTFTMGPVVLGVGAFAGALVNFIIIGLVVFGIAKLVIREEKEEKEAKK